MATSQSAARLGHHRAVHPLRRWRHGTIADGRHRLVSPAPGYSGNRFWQIHFPGRGWRDVLLDGLAEWPDRRRLAVWLCVVARGLDAVCEIRRPERTRHPAR